MRDDRSLRSGRLSQPRASADSGRDVRLRPAADYVNRLGRRRLRFLVRCGRLLYVTIGAAGWRLSSSGSPQTRALHLAQLTLNAIWPMAFFDIRHYGGPAGWKSKVVGTPAQRG
jgi:TspO/MBR family